MTPTDSLKRRMKDFSPSLPDAPDLLWGDMGERGSIEARQFPVPNLLLYLLREVCGFPLGEREDKTHWIVPFAYKNVNYVISHEKFGLRFYMEKNALSQPKEVLGKLQKAIEAAEKHILSGIAKDQVSKGNVTIVNKFNQLSGQYHYFREIAFLAYSSKNSSQEKLESIDTLSTILNRQFSVIREAAFNALAMIDAYFSRLEHLLVLAFPFHGYDREKDNLANFVGLIWSEKFRRVLECSHVDVQKYFSVLKSVKEKYRNTFAHGGFEKNGQSFFFHLNGYGAIPASMSGLRDSVHFNYIPVDKESFKNICALFDEFDTYLATTAMPKAWKLADSSLNLVLDKENLSKMLKMAENNDSYEDWIEKESHLTDIYQNADY